MSWQAFETYAPAKWVLAGEHAVLRGATAIAIPHSGLGLKLKFDPNGAKNSSFEVTPKSAESLIVDLLKAVDDSLPFPGFPRGLLQLEGNIPSGAGFGSSAALCVALTRWLSGPLGISARDESDFATRLEHRFHGRSSGMDVAVCALGEPIAFSMEKGAQSLGIRRFPRFTFHDTGLRARTSECVLRVEKFREESPVLASQTDESMALAARESMEGLFLFDAGSHERGLTLIGQAMKRSQECFLTWGLVPAPVQRLIEQVCSQGALAARLTGAGGGGFVVALWPPSN